MNSEYLKACLVSYFRFKRGVSLLATECGWFSADVLFVRKQRLHEVEIKTSWSDFKADFKKPKHEFFLKGVVHPSMKEMVYAKDNNGRYILENGYAKRVGKKLCSVYKCSNPHYFSFAVPEVLGEKILKELESNYPEYGLYSISDLPYYPNAVRVLKRPRLLHNNKLSGRIKKTILARLSSEMARERIKHLESLK